MLDSDDLELHEGELVLRALLDGTSDLIFLKDRMGGTVFANAACTRLLGLPATAIRDKDVTELFHGDEATAMQTVDQEVLRTGQPKTVEETIATAHETRVYQTTKTPFRCRAGRVIGIIGVSRDITERKRIERELRESESWQRLAVEAARLGLWRWDVRNNQLVWTPRCRSIHGIGPDEPVTYARFLALLEPGDRATTERAIQRALAECSDYRAEHRVIRPDGCICWVSTSASVVCDEGCKPESMVGIAADVTAETDADRERAELLARAQAAQAEAQAATSAKDEFLAVLSHELRAPLQSMLGWTEMMKAPGADSRVLARGLETITRNIKQQMCLIEDLLDIARIASGKLRLAKQRVALAPIITAAIASVRAAADARSIVLKTTLTPRPAEVSGDPVRLEQIVVNLLTNAVKFTPAQGTVEVRLDRSGPSAQITVTDTGAGIAAEFLPHVFERFKQAECTAGRSQGGLGLGLSIVQHLVECHGGSVTAESAGKGLGARFIVTLPLVEGERE
jgi:PAS domain S-box-containing protein